MKHFLKMVELARVKPIYKFHSVGYGSYGKPEKIKPDYFLSLIERNNIFVFDNPSIGNSDEFTIRKDVAKSFLDLPFGLSSFEVCGDAYFKWIADFKGSPEEHKVFCWLINELSPNRYEYFSLMESPGDRVYVAYTNSDGDFSLIGNNHLKFILDKINIGKTGIENINQKVKLGKRMAKSFYHINKIVHVSTRKEYLKTKPIGINEIDWQHRWSVRGHWRNVTGLGKDRSGHYCIENHTWVTDHIRGPEDMPFIRKPRILPGVRI